MPNTQQSAQPTQPQAPAQQKKSSWWKWVLGGCGLLLFLFIIAVVGCSFLGKKAVDTVSEGLNNLNTSLTSGASQKIEVEKNIGDEITLSTMKFKVNQAEEKQTLSGNFGSPAVAKENAKFVVLDLDITNITDDNFNFFPNNTFKLVDNQGRKFTTYGDSIGSVKNYLEVRELTPSIKENGALVYEIPTDATSYSLIADEKGNKEVYKIKLK